MYGIKILCGLALAFLFGCATSPPATLEVLEHSQHGVTTNFFFRTSGARAEAYLSRPEGRGPFPLMILLHGHSWRRGGAERIVPAAEAFASDLCYAGLAVSLPGYGQTEIGDSMDPEVTVRVVLDAVALVKKLSWIDADRLYLYGFSKGGLFASLLVNRIKGLKGVVLQSGAYDLRRLYHDTSNPWLRSMLNPAQEDDPKLLSVLPQVSAWAAPILILHGSRDTLVPVNQAMALRDSLEALKKPHRLVLYPDSGHRLPSADVREEAATFLKESSGSACRTNAP